MKLPRQIEKIVQILLKYKARVNVVNKVRANIHIQDHNGETPLSYAIRRCLAYKQHHLMDFIKLLLKSKSDDNLLDDNLLVIGDTVLHYAIKHMNLYMIELILCYNPDLRIRNCHEETPKDTIIAKQKALLLEVSTNQDENEKCCIKIMELIKEKLIASRIESYTFLFKSWIILSSSNDQKKLEQQHQNGQHHEMAYRPSTKKC